MKKPEVSPLSPGALSHNPLAGLASVAPDNLPRHQPPPESQPATPPQWTVGKTRKGGYAIALERRAAGKVVTILRNVSGDSQALLRELKKRCGAGGVAREDAIELQGDHQAALLRFLNTP